MAVLTDMSRPLGATVGNALELIEAVECLEGGGPDDLRELSLELVARMLVAVGSSESVEVGRETAAEALAAGDGRERLEQMVVAQGGDAGVLDDPVKLMGATEVLVVRAPRGGRVVGLDALAVGTAAAGLGAARQVQGGVIDDSAGVRILAGVGSEVSEGDGVLELLARDPGRLEPAAVLARAGIESADEPGVPRGLVLGTIDAESLSEPTP